MTDKRWKRITKLFSHALELEKEERHHWLEEQCRDDRAMIEEVRSLLDAFTPEGPLNKPIHHIRKLAFSDLQQQCKGKTIGAYTILELIGAGGMGMVYRARDTRLDRDVAIKIPPAAWSLKKNAATRFLQEARMVASIDHPNVCTIHEADKTSDGTLYMVMSCYNGATLQERLERDLPGVDEALDIAIQTARGLASAHKMDLVHRDIKPANIMVTHDGMVKILDFGIAKAADLGLTQTDYRPGTVAYMAPEQAEDGPVDHRADIWSLGIMLYEMLTGRHPFKSGNGSIPAGPADAPVGARASAKPPRTSTRNSPPDTSTVHSADLPADLPPGLERIINRALKRDPSSRYASATEMLDDLEGCRYDVGTRGAPVRPIRSIQTFRDTLRKPAILLPILAAFAAMAIMAIRIYDRQTDIRWARDQAPAEIGQMIDTQQFAGAFSLASSALGYVPDDPVLDNMFRSASVPVSIASEPDGIRFMYKPQLNPHAPWTKAGITPIENLLFPRGNIRWCAEKEGYATGEGTFATLWRTLDIAVVEDVMARDEMVWVPQGYIRLGGDRVFVVGFWIDRYEELPVDSSR
jgi:serine/threonine protein kinase